MGKFFIAVLLVMVSQVSSAMFSEYHCDSFAAITKATAELRDTGEPIESMEEIIKENMPNILQDMAMEFARMAYDNPDIEPQRMEAYAKHDCMRALVEGE